MSDLDLRLQSVCIVSRLSASPFVDVDPRVLGLLALLVAQSHAYGAVIGLATMQRTVQRHAGRIWAEAALDQAVTFFFTRAARAAETNRGANA